VATAAVATVVAGADSGLWFARVPPPPPLIPRRWASTREQYKLSGYRVPAVHGLPASAGTSIISRPWRITSAIIFQQLIKLLLNTKKIM
jgi:hypothetical protein